MARIRTIKPDFFINDSLAELPPLDRLLFIGLWTQADRMGRLEDRPRKIKVALLPYDDHDVNLALDRLSQKTFITRYSMNGDNYIQINNFLKHQYPNIKESESTIPAPYQHHASTSHSGKERKARKDSASTISDNFLKVWESYPRKVGKQKALQVWNKLQITPPLEEKILKAIELQKKNPQWIKDNGQFIPHLATWLNQARWEDEIIIQKDWREKQ